MDIRSFFNKGKGESSGQEKKTTRAAERATSQSKRVPKPKKPIKLEETIAIDDSDEDMDAPSVPKIRKRLQQRSKAVEESDSDEDMPSAKKEPSPEPKLSSKSPKKEVTKKVDSSSSTSVTIKTEKQPLPIDSTSSIKQEFDTLGRSKDPVSAPHPVPGCLDNTTFVFTGDMLNISRNDAIHLVKQCGGSVAKSVTKKTHYLVLGDTLENGDAVSVSAKYKAAVENNVRMLTQNDFYNLIADKASFQEKKNAQKPAPARQVSSHTSQDYLWPDKYKPKTVSDLIGLNAKAKTLADWLRDWHAIHVAKTKPMPKSFKNDNPGAKTVLLSGPPGIGKTSMATIVAEDLGFEVLELNASDTRSKKMLQSGLTDVLGTRTLQFGSSKGMSLGKRVVVMDEVDGMSGGDRGGTAELIQLIKKSRTPIICICNDRQSQKVRSLANSALDLRIARPTKVAIAKRMMDIASKEGLEVEKNAMEEAVERCGNDIRQLLTQMQRWKLTTNRVTYDDLVNPKAAVNKDEVLRLNPFSATQQIFAKDASFAERNEAYFVDYDLMPLMVQENYLKSVMHGKGGVDDQLEVAALAADFIGESDIVSNYVRSDQRWDLLTKQAALNVAACIHSKGYVGQTEFSKWLGKNSTATKSKRLLSELSVRMRSHASGSRQVIRLDYVPFMKEILLTKLLSGDDHVAEVIELLDACQLTRTDLVESMESFGFPNVKRHSYSQLDTKAKSAFTRQYNKAVHTSQAVVESSLSSTTITKGRKKTASAEEEGGLAPPSDAEEEEEEDQDADVSQFQKKAKATGKRKAASSTSGRGRGRGKKQRSS